MKCNGRGFQVIGSGRGFLVKCSGRGLISSDR